MATKGKKNVAKKPKKPVCRIPKDAQGNPRKTKTGKTIKMCFDEKGKITSEAKVKAWRQRQRKKAA